MQKKKTSNPVSRYLSKIGKKGGMAGKGEAKARTSEQARDAVNARWAKRKESSQEGPVASDDDSAQSEH